MSLDNKCEMPNCDNKAKRLTSTESKIIEICDNCWHKIYRS